MEGNDTEMEGKRENCGREGNGRQGKARERKEKKRKDKIRKEKKRKGGNGNEKWKENQLAEWKISYSFPFTQYTCC